jgi:hypothetical protein
MLVRLFVWWRQRLVDGQWLCDDLVAVIAMLIANRTSTRICSQGIIFDPLYLSKFDSKGWKDSNDGTLQGTLRWVQVRATMFMHVLNTVLGLQVRILFRVHTSAFVCMYNCGCQCGYDVHVLGSSLPRQCQSWE